jgi:hypothetical protein
MNQKDAKNVEIREKLIKVINSVKASVMLAF